MKYMGSKNRIAKHILPIMIKAANEKEITNWIEPFVSGGNMIDKVPHSFLRLGVDANLHTIMALVAIRDMVDELPDEVTEEYYKSLKGTEATPITSWVRFVSSFGGKFENGYAREKGTDAKTFVGYGKRNAKKKQSPNLQNVKLICGNYDEVIENDVNCLIYCDPPYEGTTSYKTNSFDYNKFWDWCRKMTENNLVFISEYNAPDDFECVWSGEVKTNFASQRKQSTHNAVEKLFKYKNGR